MIFLLSAPGLSGMAAAFLAGFYLDRIVFNEQPDLILKRHGAREVGEEVL